MAAAAAATAPNGGGMEVDGAGEYPDCCLRRGEPAAEGQRWGDTTVRWKRVRGR